MLTPLDIHNKVFTRAFRGYRMEEVDAFLDEIIRDQETYFRENKELKDRIVLLEEEMGKSREVSSALEKTMLLAQRVHDEEAARAKKAADVILHEAENKGDKIVQDAERDVLDARQRIEHLRLYEKQLYLKHKGFLEFQMELLDGYKDKELVLTDSDMDKLLHGGHERDLMGEDGGQEQTLPDVVSLESEGAEAGMTGITAEDAAAEAAGAAGEAPVYAGATDAAGEAAAEESGAAVMGAAEAGEPAMRDDTPSEYEEAEMAKAAADEIAATDITEAAETPAAEEEWAAGAVPADTEEAAEYAHAGDDAEADKPGISGFTVVIEPEEVIGQYAANLYRREGAVTDEAADGGAAQDDTGADEVALNDGGLGAQPIGSPEYTLANHPGFILPDKPTEPFTAGSEEPGDAGESGGAGDSPFIVKDETESMEKVVLLAQKMEDALKALDDMYGSPED
ncbi:MAG: DivIVA domain-containing protein [Clostridiales bacterium]|nr:DivIVA domain-containing protein [Clostridiales bacterium]